MNELQIFTNSELGQIRALTIDDIPWFVGKDVACLLGYSKPLNALATHVDEDDSLKQGLTDSLGRIQPTIIINESGLYSLILSSKLPSAKKFKRWVTSEVLPAIRKTGSYMMPAVRTPEKDFQYWANLPRKSEDFEKILDQERARIGMNECRKRARALAKAEYKEYHANSPILIGNSDEGYYLTEEAQERALYYLNNYASNTIRTNLLFYKIMDADVRVTEIEAEAINCFMRTLPDWQFSPVCVTSGVVHKVFSNPKFLAWKRKDIEND